MNLQWIKCTVTATALHRLTANENSYWMTVPRQWSAAASTCRYPSGQTHMKDPTRFLHAWRHLLAGVGHSSTSDAVHTHTRTHTTHRGRNDEQKCETLWLICCRGGHLKMLATHYTVTFHHFFNVSLLSSKLTLSENLILWLFHHGLCLSVRLISYRNYLHISFFVLVLFLTVLVTPHVRQTIGWPALGKLFDAR